MLETGFPGSMLAVPALCLQLFDPTRVFGACAFAAIPKFCVFPKFAKGKAAGLPFPGSKVVYSCEAGHFPTQTSAVCNEDGTLNNPSPSCKPCATAECTVCPGNKCEECGKGFHITAEGNCRDCALRGTNVIEGSQKITVSSQCWQNRDLLAKYLTDGKGQPKTNGDEWSAQNLKSLRIQ